MGNKLYKPPPPLQQSSVSRMPRWLVYIVAAGQPVAAWHQSLLRRVAGARSLPPPRLCADEDDQIADSDQTVLFASLRARQLDIERECTSRWRKAQCTSSINLALDGWVRRLAVEWPKAAIGTADGSVVIADLSSGQVISRAVDAHPARIGNEASARDMRLLHGAYDGGGLTAISLRGDFVVSAGRDGGARLWQIGAGKALKAIGALKDNTAVVSAIVLAADDDQADDIQYCWLARLDGTVSRWEWQPAAVAVDGAAESPAFCKTPRCTLQVEAGSAVLDLALHPSRPLIACSTALGSVELFSSVDGTTLGVWSPLAFDGSRGYKGERARSVALATVRDSDCVFVGGSDGPMHARPLMPTAQADDNGHASLFASSLPGQLMTPSHGGAVVALTPIVVAAGQTAARTAGSAANFVVSGAQDGTLRLWDLESMRAAATSQQGPVCLFGLGGYKVWLGSVCTDGQRLISDGRDNTILVHDFGAEPAD